MAVTNTLVKHAGKMPSAPNILLALDVALDNSYPTGGYAFDPGALLQSLGGYDKVPVVASVLFEQNKGGFQFEFDRGNNKIIIRTAAGVEVANTFDLPGAGLADIRANINAC